MPTAGKPYVRLLLFGVLLFVLGLGWGGVGGHVNVPGTSYMIYCHVAKISGIAYYVTCCYASTFEASTFDAHDVYLICQKSIDFASTFFDQIQFSKEFGRAFYIVNYRWLWLSWKQTNKTLARFPFRRDVYNRHFKKVKACNSDISTENIRKLCSNLLSHPSDRFRYAAARSVRTLSRPSSVHCTSVSFSSARDCMIISE